MITLVNVSQWQPGTRRSRPILLNCSLHCGQRDRIGILAAPGSGKTSLARLFCGIDQPDQGQVLIQGRPSWPLGFAGFMHPELRVGQNIATIAKLCGFSADRAMEFVERFVALPGVLFRKTENLSPSERALVAYAISIGLPSDVLIADEVITVGSSLMREKCKTHLQEVLRDSGLIFISRSPRALKEHCDQFYLLIGHELKPCADLDAGLKALEIHARELQELEVDYA